MIVMVGMTALDIFVECKFYQDSPIVVVTYFRDCIYCRLTISLQEWMNQGGE